MHQHRHQHQHQPISPASCHPMGKTRLCPSAWHRGAALSWGFQLPANPTREWEARCAHPVQDSSLSPQAARGRAGDHAAPTSSFQLPLPPPHVLQVSPGTAWLWGSHLQGMFSTSRSLSHSLFLQLPGGSITAPSSQSHLCRLRGLKAVSPPAQRPQNHLSQGHTSGDGHRGHPNAPTLSWALRPAGAGCVPSSGAAAGPYESNPRFAARGPCSSLHLTPCTPQTSILPPSPLVDKSHGDKAEPDMLLLPLPSPPPPIFHLSFA